MNLETAETLNGPFAACSVSKSYAKAGGSTGVPVGSEAALKLIVKMHCSLCFRKVSQEPSGRVEAQSSAR